MAQTIETWLSNVIYDEHGQQIFNSNIQLVVDIFSTGKYNGNYEVFRK